MWTTLFVLSSISTSPAFADSSIIGGDPTQDFEAVGTLVGIFPDDSIMDFCSGTLIRDNIVVTAAHCIPPIAELEEMGANSFAFVIGTTLMDEDGVWDWSYIEAAQMHPEYDDRTLANDIALIQLSEPITTTSPIPVNTEEPPLDRHVTYVGWGKTNENDDYSTGVKHTVSVPTGELTDTVLTTYDPSGRNICNGDSGGAALMADDDGNYWLVGINSFGYDVYGRAPHCGGDGAAGGATRADAYVDWMCSLLGEDCVGSGSVTEGLSTDNGPIPGAPGEAGGSHSGAGGRPVVQTSATCSTTGSSGGLGLGLLALLGLVRRRR